VAKEPTKPNPREEATKRAKAMFAEAVRAQNDGNTELAIERYNKVLNIAPGYISALNNLGVSLRKLNKLDQAIACYRRALERDPRNVQTLSNFGNALKDAGRHAESLDMFRRAMEADPSDAGMVYNFGITLKDAGLIDESIEVFKLAQKLNPDLPDIGWDMALSYLVKGDFERGWPAYETRWVLNYTPDLRFPDRQWDGKPMKGTLLLATEQGYGDAIQFVRYAPIVRAMVDRVVLECREGLETIFSGVEGIDEVIVRGNRLPDFDAFMPLLSLPRVLKTTPDTIPANVPYLPIDPERQQRARQILAPLGKRLKVGIVWGGSPGHRNDANRSLAFENFLELLRVPNLALISLQKGERVAEMNASGCGALVSNLDPVINDFADTAAFAAELDLVIMCDSSVAHLAGAIGKPVWVLLPFSPDWRWLLERSDSPWYPTMRLFRQREPRRWDGVFRDVVAALREVADVHVRKANG
jgi:Tfp pilus assembly protein PilF